MMKVGISSFSFRWATKEDYLKYTNPLEAVEIVEKAAEMGAEVVQLCDNLSMPSMSMQELRRLKQRADTLGVELELGLKGLSVEHLEQAEHICQQIGSSLVRVVIGNGKSAPSEDEVVSLIATGGKKLFENDVRIAIENHFHYTPKQLDRIVCKIDNELLGICLDPINSISLLVSPSEAVEYLLEHTLSLHVKDATISRLNTGFYISGTEIGKGMLNISELIKKVINNGKDANLLVEGWMDKEPSEEATLEKEKQWIRKGIEFIRRSL
jgi:3-oxoisoapionate decarboxylase